MPWKLCTLRVAGTRKNRKLRPIYYKKLGYLIIYTVEYYIMFRKLCALRVTGTRFCVSCHGARKYYGGGAQIFLKGSI